MKKSLKDLLVYALAYLVVLTTVFIVFGLLFIEIPEKNKDVLYIVLGVIVSGFTAVIQFFFGSSSSSKDKTDLIKAPSLLDS